MSTSAELVPDPVSHISISGIHGRKALEERLARAAAVPRSGNGDAVAPLLAGAILGAALMYLLNPRRHAS